MKARVPKELTPGQRRRTEEWAKSVVLDELEHQGRVMLDTMIKIFCLIMHDAFGYGEKRLLLILGQLRGVFLQQQNLVKEGKQKEYLDKRMDEIFKKGGYPDDYFARMFEGGLK